TRLFTSQKWQRGCKVTPKPRHNYSLRSKKRLPGRRKMDMTVCVAAITEINTLIGISDRMMTAGDVEFEPEQSKIWPLTKYIVAMVAGDFALQVDILRPVEIEV